MKSGPRMFHVKHCRHQGRLRLISLTGGTATSIPALFGTTARTQESLKSIDARLHFWGCEWSRRTRGDGRLRNHRSPTLLEAGSDATKGLHVSRETLPLVNGIRSSRFTCSGNDGRWPISPRRNSARASCTERRRIALSSGMFHVKHFSC